RCVAEADGAVRSNVDQADKLSLVSPKTAHGAAERRRMSGRIGEFETAPCTLPERDVLVVAHGLNIDDPVADFGAAVAADSSAAHDIDLGAPLSRKQSPGIYYAAAQYDRRMPFSLQDCSVSDRSRPAVRQRPTDVHSAIDDQGAAARYRVVDQSSARQNLERNAICSREAGQSFLRIPKFERGAGREGSVHLAPVPEE